MPVKKKWQNMISVAGRAATESEDLSGLEEGNIIGKSVILCK